MSYINKLVLIGVTVIIGVVMVGVVVASSNEASFDLAEYNYTETVTGEVSSITPTYNSQAGGSLDSWFANFSIDDTYMVLGNTDKEIWKFNSTTGLYEIVVGGFDEVLNSINDSAFSSDNSYLFTAHSGSPYIDVWEANGDDTYGQSTDIIGTGFSSSVNSLHYFTHNNNQYVAFTSQSTGNQFGVLMYDGVSRWDKEYTDTSNGNCYDVDYHEVSSTLGYLAVGCLSTGYYSIVKLESGVFTELTTTPVLSAQVYRVKWSDAGSRLLFGSSDTVLIYDFASEDLTPVTMDIAPAGLVLTKSLEWVGNTTFYVGGDTLLKYVYDSANNEFDLAVNDLTTYTGDTEGIDFNNSYTFGAVGDDVNVNFYTLTSEGTADAITLPFEPYQVDTVTQSAVEKTFTVDGRDVTIESPDLNEDATITYQVGSVSEYSNLIFVIPLIASVIVIATVIKFVKVK